jgi:hypothetical protein
MAHYFEAMAGALSMDERLNAAAEQQMVPRFSYMALLMGEYGDAPLDFWGQGSGAVPTSVASCLAFVGNAAMPVQQQQAVLDELLAGEDKKTLLGSCRREGGQVEASRTLWLCKNWRK